MDIKDYTYFLAVAEHQNITKAAQSIYISQPTLSVYLKHLESRVGFPLFVRSGSKLMLTREGRVYEEYARRITQLCKELDQYFIDLGNLEVGTVKIGITGNRASIILGLLPTIKKELPNVGIELVEHSSIDLEEDIATHRLDFAMLSLPFRNHTLKYKQLYTEEVVVGIPNSFNIHCKPKIKSNSKYPLIDISDLKDYPFILNSPNQRLRQISDYLFLSKGITPNTYMETNSIFNVSTAIKQGIAIGFLLDSYINTFDIDTGDVSFYSIDTNSNTKMPYVIAYPEDGYLSTPANECINIISGILAR